MEIRFPDPEYAGAFQAYRNYFEDLAGMLGGRYGLTDSLVVGVYQSVAAHPPVTKLRRRTLSNEEQQALDRALRKAWGALRRVHHEVADPDAFDEEANAWLPVQSYYAVYHCVLAYAIASGQAVPREHAPALKLIGKDVVRGLLPYPWSVSCTGCPQLRTHSWSGLGNVSSVHVWSRPDPDTTDDRLAMFLRTTRQKELERRFSQARERQRPRAGRTRANLPRAEKERLAGSMTPTTLFDVLWRLRKTANYDDADVFVLGAMTQLDALRLGQSLAIVTDATIAALEAVIAGYLGPQALADLAAGYVRRVAGGAGSTALTARANYWQPSGVSQFATNYRAANRAPF